MGSKKLIICMLFGFALVCGANLLCFFPQTLLQIPPLLYRLYNLTAGLSIVGGSLLGTMLALSRIKRPEKIMLTLGYISLFFGMVGVFLAGDGSFEVYIILAGVTCGFGIGLLMVCWFSFLALIPERYAMLTQGGQALLGSLIFVGISTAFSNYAFAGAIVCLLLSAMLSVIIYRQGAVPDSGLISQDSLRRSLKVFSDKGSLGRSFTVSLFAFVLISLLYGIITAVIMSPESHTNALEQVIWGGIIGASTFLLWAFFSKKRDYSFVIKAFFGVLAFVLILPIEGHGIATAIGYQLICLLFFSLVIDTFSTSRRALLLIISLSYALTRGLFLVGLYVPGQFGVASYGDFFNSASLLFFLVYLVFIALLFILNREKKQLFEPILPNNEENAERKKDFSEAGEDSGAGYRVAKVSAYKSATGHEKLSQAEQGLGKQFESLNNGVGSDITVASQRIGKKNGLTKRETEVLGYLARGRDAAFICKELYLSRNTVKSYMKAIYAKLGVHSHQQLIDVVDREAEEKDGC